MVKRVTGAVPLGVLPVWLFSCTYCSAGLKAGSSQSVLMSPGGLVYVLGKSRVGVNYFPAVVENGYSSFEVLEVFQQPFPPGARLASLFVQFLVGFHYLTAYLAEFRVGEVDFYIRQPSPFGFVYECAQA